MVLLLAAGPLSAQMQVRVEPVRLAPIVDRLPLSGSIISPRQANVAPQESGLVRRMAVDVGDIVAEGDVLLELDDELLRLELRRLQAALEEARLLYEDAQRLADEGRRLVGERNISRSEYESRLANEGTAEQRKQQLSAEVEMQQTRVRRATLRAPFAGVIGLKMTEEGQWLAAGSPAFNLAQLDPLRVQARVPERFYREVRPGTPISVTFDALPGETVQTAVDSVVAVSDLETRSFTARVDIPIAGGELNIGLHEYRQLIERNCYDIIQADAAFSEGISQLRKVAGMAEMAFKKFIPHTWSNGIGLGANLHLAAATPNCPWFEFPVDPPAWTEPSRDFMLAEPYLIDDDGTITVPQEPGFGFKLDRGALDDHTIQTWESEGA
jgi:RND family efflux transporter MFP subunit